MLPTLLVAMLQHDLNKQVATMLSKIPILQVQSRLQTQILAIPTGALQMSKEGLHLVMTQGIFWISDGLPLDTDDFEGRASRRFR